MANTYSRDILKVVVAQICQTIGWHTICTTPLEVLTDVLGRFLRELGNNAHRYGEQFGHTSPTVWDVTLAFKELGVNVSELAEYVKYVEAVPCAVSVPKYPLNRESHLNLLKPGSREVVTRPVHIHEHLPAMHPQLEEEEYLKQLPLSVDITGSEPSQSPLSSPKSLFKRPGDPVSIENNLLKRARLMLEEEGRPLREISSVMMTTSGFLSPAREGKLPEARTPLQSSDSRSSSPQPSCYPTVPPEVKGEKKAKKYSKSGADGTKKSVEKDISHSKTKVISSNNLGPDDDDPNVKKLVSMKETHKLKVLKPKMHSPNNSASVAKAKPKHKNAPGMSASIMSLPKIPKLSQKNKGDKSANSHGSKTNEKVRDSSVIEGKLSSEPDKQKLNIFKKISKVKEEKSDLADILKSSTDFFGSADMDNRHRLSQIDETIESVIQNCRESQEKRDTPKATSTEQETVDILDSSDSELFFNDDLSPPGTPSTPRTPDLIPPKKSDKHLDSKKRKKAKKDRDRKEIRDRYAHSPSPKRFKSESTESDYSFLDKPKTPEVESSRDDIPILPRNREDMMSSHPFPFNFPYAAGPGLIPPSFANNPLINRFNLPLGKPPGLMLPHPAMPNLSLPPPLLLQSKLEEATKSKKQPSLSPTPAPAAQSARVSPVPRASPVTVAIVPDTPEVHNPSSTTAKEKPIEKKKEHKKDKKEKIKKKKDKKEKLKNKEKGEKKKIKNGKKIKDKDKNKEKKEKKEKKKDKEREDKEKPETSVPKLTLKLGPPSPQGGSAPIIPETTHRKIVIKPVIEPPKMETSKEEKRSPSPELARISALVTRPTHSKPPPVAHSQPVAPLAEASFAPSPPLKKPSAPGVNKLKTKEPPKKVETEKKANSAFYFDKEGNQVWICPACGGQDDGSPMIGCDGCDAWYHWVCVGIQVPPDSNDWFCRVCIAKRQDGLVSDKKKKGEKKKKKA